MLYCSNNYVYTYGNTAYEAYINPLANVSLCGNVSGEYVTTAYLHVFDQHGSLYTSASSTGDLVNVQVPTGHQAYVSAKTPDYWSAANIDTNLTNFTQGDSEYDNHARTGSAVITADATFYISNSSVGYRYFSGIAEGYDISNHPSDASDIYSVVEPFTLLSGEYFTGDQTILTTAYASNLTRRIDTATQNKWSESGIRTVTSIRHDVGLKDVYIEVGNQTDKIPDFPYRDDTPYYIFRSMDGTATRGSLDIYSWLAGSRKTNIYNFYTETATAFPATCTASGSASSYSIGSSYNDANYFGCELTLNTNEWTRYSYVSVLPMGSAQASTYTGSMPSAYMLTPNVFISGISQ